MKKDLHKDRPPPIKIQRPISQDDRHRQYHFQSVQTQQRQDHAFGAPNSYRQPVITHTYSPEIIQTDSRNFMQLVQSLTGPGSQPPPAKRTRITANPLPLAAPPLMGGSSVLPRERHRPPPLPLSRPSARPGLPPIPPPPVGSHVSTTPHTPHHSLLSPSMFDFSPSVLPSPSTLTFDFTSLLSPAAMLQQQQQQQAGPSNFLPSPGPLSVTGFFADLPLLSPAAYSWIDRHASSAEALLAEISKPRLLAASPRPATSGPLLLLPPATSPDTTTPRGDS